MRSPFALSSGRRRRRALGWALVALLLSLGLARLHDYRGWDQNFYLGMTSSLVEDGDVDLRNDLLHLHSVPSTLRRALTSLEPTGAVANTFAIGSSILWLPPYVLTMPWQARTALPAARWSHTQLVALHLFSLGLMVWLLWVLDRWLRRLGSQRWLAALGAVALVLGTPLVIYGFRAYMGSHQASAVAVMLLILATLRLGDRPTTASALLWGVALGLVFLCRWQDVVKGVILLVPILQLRRRGLSPRRWARLAAVAAAGALVMAGLQLHAWLLERGEIFGMPQGKHYLELSDPALGRFLLSGLSGLLPWSPLFAVGLLGLLLPWRCRLPAAWRWLALGLLLFDIYLNAAVHDWWGGAAYGARRMCSDVPLLAVGLANLGAWRRLRLPLAGVLAICCLWGGVTANLRMHGLRDLGILFQGHPSGPLTERTTAQPSQAEAIEVATSWPFGLGTMTYFAERSTPNRLLTVGAGALVCLLAGWALGRARAPGALGTVLAALLAVVLFAHFRLLTGPRADAEERELWARLSRAATGGSSTELSPETLAAIEGYDDRFVDARRFLRAEAARRQGRAEQARALLAGPSSYPFTPRLLEALSMAAGERLLITRRGFFHRILPQRPAQSLTMGRRVELACEALRLTVTVRVRSVEPDSGGTLVSVGLRGERPLATVELAGEGRVALSTASARDEASLDWGPSGPHRLELSWSPRAGRVELSAAGSGDDRARLAAPAVAAAGEAGRFEVVIGTRPAALPGRQPPWGTRFSHLQVIARNVCRGRR